MRHILEAECLVVWLSWFYGFKYCKSRTKKYLDDLTETPLWLMHLIRCWSPSLIHLNLGTHNACTVSESGLLLSLLRGRTYLTVRIHLACDTGVYLIDSDVLNPLSSRKIHRRRNCFGQLKLHSEWERCKRDYLSYHSPSRTASRCLTFVCQLLSRWHSKLRESLAFNLENLNILLA